MQAAKAQFSLAALACLRGSLEAPAQVSMALGLIEKARAELRRLADGEQQ